MKTQNTMKPLSEYFKTSSAYWGERSDWLVAYATHRDADCLARSNWRSFIRKLGGTGEEGAKGSQEINENLAIEEANHWAVGWVQYLLIAPTAADLIAKAEEINADLEDYPVVDEMDWSQLEYDEYCKFFARDAKDEFRRHLKEHLSDRALDLIDSAEPMGPLVEWFEAQIPSGEYQHDGYPCFDYALCDVSRDQIATLLRCIRDSKRAAS